MNTETRISGRPPGVARRSRLTRESVDKLPTPGHGSYYVYDRDVRRLAVRVLASGKRIYTVRAYVRGVQRWTVLGEHGQPAGLLPGEVASGHAGRTWVPEEARAAATRLLGLHAAGLDPTEARRALRGSPTFREQAREYAKDTKATKGAATWDSDLRLFGLEDLREKHRAIRDRKAKTARRILDEPFARKKTPDVSHEDVKGLMRRWRATPVRANRALSLLSHFFGWAGVTPNPCTGVERNPETKRRRYLTGEELTRLGQALAESDEDARAVAAVRLLLFTGARRSEVLTLEWERRDGCRGFVDFESAKLTLLASKTGAKDVILAPPALAVLRSVKRLPGNPFVFAGEAPGKPLQNLGHVWDNIRKTANIKDVRLHDLRHSFASVAASGGASLPLIGGLLGHTTPATTARYAHLLADPLRVVAEKTAKDIDRAMAGKAS